MMTHYSGWRNYDQACLFSKKFWPIWPASGTFVTSMTNPFCFQKKLCPIPCISKELLKKKTHCSLSRKLWPVSLSSIVHYWKNCFLTNPCTFANTFTDPSSSSRPFAQSRLLRKDVWSPSSSFLMESYPLFSEFWLMTPLLKEFCPNMLTPTENLTNPAKFCRNVWPILPSPAS